jgi:hypothetical protein
MVDEGRGGAEAAASQEEIGRVIMELMSFPIKICVICSEEFELKPDKPGFANRCPECSEPESTASVTKQSADPVERKASSEMNAERRRAIRDLLYRKES